ncbi:VapC toxin family PIN domain ribonuclease [Rhizobium rhizosphaerae]|uniref:Ribonuclease VapC n=1 Tax=Xaviernesmea rhizosphaerae TaxID=1672749 RepID=A0ABX3PHF4_9HYPH|nr:type II toxin-antitoxin system VapC family toxin [Xaviernesmea rhizosphaerae]OQP87615.1 VapC toxin family PIN domain ribonuclease [Xaviernesmea rhizosphaerae]
MILLDTHVLIWALEDDRRLAGDARERLRQSAQLAVSAISIWEIAMLVERRRLVLTQDLEAWVAKVLAIPQILLIPIDPAIAIDSVRLPPPFHPDPADRVVVATARFLRAPLMTADRAILAYADAGHVDVIAAG